MAKRNTQEKGRCVVCGSEFDCNCGVFYFVDANPAPIQPPPPLPPIVLEIKCDRRGESYGLENCGCSRATKVYECELLDSLCVAAPAQGDIACLSIRTAAGTETSGVIDCRSCDHRVSTETR